MKTSIILTLAFLLCSCQFKTQTKEHMHNALQQTDTTLLDSTYSFSEDEYQYFQVCGFAIKAPCKLKDVSQHVHGNSFINYGGIINEDDPNKMTAYQIIVNRLPVGYKDLSKQELAHGIEKLMKESMANFSNYKPIRFSYNEYPGYVMTCTTKGYAQKGVMFWKDNFIICLTIITNDGLNEKFNKFTNSFKSIKAQDTGNKVSQNIDNKRAKKTSDTNKDPFEGIRPQPISPHSRYANRPQLIKSPLADTDTPWGESMWDDETANAAEFENLGNN